MHQAADHTHQDERGDADTGQSQTSAHGHVCHHGPLGEHDEAHDIVCVDHVSYRYGSVQALENVTLHVEVGCNLGIVGPNGGGKTTLLRIMLGLLDGYEGSVRLAGLSPKQICRRGDLVGYVPQKHEFEPRFPVNVRQVVAMGMVGRRVFGWMSRADHQAVRWIMEQVGVLELADRPIGALSGGQQQRVFIARALVARPRLLLLDEPTVGVDVGGQKRFAELIHHLHEKLGLTVIVVSHDLRAVAASCGKVAVLNRTLHYHDSPAGLTPQLLQEVFQHDIAPVISA
jgi:zinc transport system ATP-binding protein